MRWECNKQMQKKKKKEKETGSAKERERGGERYVCIASTNSEIIYSPDVNISMWF